MKIKGFFIKLFLWMVTVFFVSRVIVCFPHYSGIIALIAALLVCPIKKLQEIINKYLNKNWNIILGIILYFVVVITAPSTETIEQEVSGQAVSTETVKNVEEKKNSEEEIVEEMQSWKQELPMALVADIERTFTEIGENPEYIENVEYIETTESIFYNRKDYKVTFKNASLSGVFSHETWVHNRFYRITTQEWYDSEPEKQIFPNEYLVAIKFWSDGNNTNINQWAQNGTGKLQNPDTTVLPQPEVDNIQVAYYISVEDLINEINTDKKAAGEKYNGQWIEITGTVTDISESGGLVGYYISGKRGGEGLKIVCWIYDSSQAQLKIGDAVTFIGALREVSTSNNTELGYCFIK